MSPEFMVRAHLQLELPQDFARAAAGFADCTRRKVISAQQLYNILGFERRLFHVLGGVFLQVFAVLVHIQVGRGDAWFARRGRLSHGSGILSECRGHIKHLRKAGGMESELRRPFSFYLSDKEWVIDSGWLVVRAQTNVD